jgi:hypothetical protein
MPMNECMFVAKTTRSIAQSGLGHAIFKKK